jgi:hypothetical protein
MFGKRDSKRKGKIVTRKEVVELLTRILPNDFQLEEGSKISYDDLASAMLDHIGDLEEKVRENLLYDGYIRLIEDHRLTKECLVDLFHRAIDEKHLLRGLGTFEGESVFTRSFCILLLVVLVDSHNKNPYLKKGEVSKFADRFCSIYEKENNLVGYMDQFGWAHTAAHGADLFECLTESKELRKAHYEKILTAIQKKICQGRYVFIDNEPGRMMPAVMNIMESKQLSNEEIIDWLNVFEASIKGKWGVEKSHLAMNIQNFSMQLYFRLQDTKMDNEVLIRVKKLIKAII